MRFRNRCEAGKLLATQLKAFADNANAIVVALPRGGVVVGFEVAAALNLPLEITCPRKIGAPFNPEFAIGAITETGEGILSEELIEELGISQEYIHEQIEKEKKQAEWRLKHYRQGRKPRTFKDKTILLVDDGLATGATMRAAIKTVRKEGAKKIVMAIPVAPPDTLQKLKAEVDQTICLSAPAGFSAVGQFYDFFEQVSDEEVIELLRQSA
jgi:putative phosphoribosyl transferase